MSESTMLHLVELFLPPSTLFFHSQPTKLFALGGGNECAGEDCNVQRNSDDIAEYAREWDRVPFHWEREIQDMSLSERVCSYEGADTGAFWEPLEASPVLGPVA